MDGIEQKEKKAVMKLGKVEIKLLILDDCLLKKSESTEWLLLVVKERSKMVGKKINIQDQIVVIYTATTT